MEEGLKKGDHSAETTALLPKARAQAAAGDIAGAVEALLALEKTARLHNDLPSLQVLVVEVLELLHAHKQYTLLVEHVTLLAKRRAQKSQAIGKLVTTAMGYIADCPTEDVRVALIQALRTVADGRIFLEKERAQLTQMLSQIKEKNGLIAEAADILQEVHVETYGAMTKLEKVEFILEQVRLTLAKKDYVRAYILSKKILRRVLEEEKFEAVKIKFYHLMIEYDTHENNPLELCRHWQSIFSTKTLSPAEKVSALQHAMLFAVISPHSNLQQDMLFKLAAEPLRHDLPAYATLMKLFTTKEVIPYPLPVQAEIQAHSIFADAVRGAGWLEDLHTRTTEHNIRVVATHYQRIRLPHLAAMLGLSEDAAEARISALVSAGSIYAKIDRPAKVVGFQKPQSPEELLTNWSSDISELLRLVETTCHLINKENMIHKV
ncbi:26S proteasome non-ATPase regulatory subunit 12 [Achlya hypogyna]|uniref:26S proteasome non-ATPase regulatory subunit 12 n=1 Tax=Achlya hypogyna TaxID=1202772 RepID=A0A1V9YCT8_ACHHY|nr:26S proteasome non-ATPase regulatory subunit 12 [Achlya hypogyna]